MAGSATPRELRRFLTRLGGGRLVYGRAVTSGDHTVVPVSRVRIAGGFGFGGDDEGGGGGAVDARPVGFIEVGPRGARYESIPAGHGRAAAIAAGLAAGAVAGSALAGSAVVRRLGRAVGPRARRAVRWSSRRALRRSPLRSLLR
ncbi:MAG: hypothetical protein QOE65_1802 [Solirubrobacteraceae bacterium]|nr:hypothetical protein [Solirubrobacteraceae bacterium]